MCVCVCFLCSSKCVDVKALCVAKDKLCWVLYVDVVCLSDNGNVSDAVFLAASAALKNSNFPTHNRYSCILCVFPSQLLYQLSMFPAVLLK